MSKTAPHQSLRRWLTRLHLWTGLSVGLLFALLGLTGAILVFQEPLLRWQYPMLAGHTPHASADVLEAIVRSPSGSQLRSLNLPSAEMPVWQGFGQDGTRAYFAPENGDLLLVRYPHKDVLLFLREFHTDLLAGETGHQILGALTWIILFLIISGLYLWWPKWGKIRSQLRWHMSPAALRWISWHRSLGTLALPVLLLFAVTGLSFVYSDLFRNALGSLFGDSPAAPPAKVAISDAAPDWSAILAQAQKQMPDARLRRISMPKPGENRIELRLRGNGEWHPNGRSRLQLDRSGQHVLWHYDARIQALGPRIQATFYPLHAGQVGGLPGRIFTVIAGLSAPFLFIVGLLSWLHRRARIRSG